MGQKNLNHAYCYYDNRTMKTQFAQASFIELETAYTKITSGGSLKLWLYLLHKISGRTLYDREEKPRLPYRLGIEQIERALTMSRASIYRAFGDLQKHGLVLKIKTEKQTETDNVIVFLSLPNINNEKNDTKNDTIKSNSKSQNCDLEKEQQLTKKGNSSQNADLNFDTMILEPQNQITLLTSHANESKKNEIEKEPGLKKITEDRIGKKRDDIKREEIERIMIALANRGYELIEKKEFDNVLLYLKKNEHVSNRKTYVREAIRLHNERVVIRSQSINRATAHAQAEISKRAGAGAVANVPTKEQIAHLDSIMTPPYMPAFHDSLLKKGSWVLEHDELANKLRTWIDSEKENPTKITNPFTQTENPQTFIDKLTSKFKADK